MDLESLRPLVVDFELSCLLRHAAIPQKTALYWHKKRVFMPGKTGLFLSTDPEGAYCAAYTSEELSRLLDSSFTTIRAGSGYVFIDLMACTFKKIEQQDGVEGGGLVLHMVKGCEDKTEVHCKARGVLVLAAKNILEFQRKAQQNGKHP